MPLDDTNWIAPGGHSTGKAAPTQTEVDPTTALLVRARGFIERGWCRWVFAQDTTGCDVVSTSEYAIAWCANGALFAAGLLRDGYNWNPAVLRLEAAIGGEEIHAFNNRQETVEPVLAAFDRAIAARMGDDISAPVEGRAIAAGS
jgi:hypothetical protein